MGLGSHFLTKVLKKHFQAHLGAKVMAAGSPSKDWQYPLLMALGNRGQILFWASVTVSFNCSRIWKEPDVITKEERGEKKQRCESRE